MTRASEFSGKTRKQALARSGYRCEWTEADGSRCTAALRPGHVHYDHKRPLALGGTSTLENCQCLCPTHHRLKTATEDVPRIREADRQRASIYGAKTRKGAPIRSPGFAKADRQPKRLDPSKIAHGQPEWARRVKLEDAEP